MPRKGRGIRLLRYPPPYRSWLALSSDPDATTIENWAQVHELVWEELELPFADSFFIESYNEQVRPQVTLAEHPEILDSHPHDTMHTWGDFVHAPSHRFTRRDAESGLARLRELGCVPRVWTDHSNFTGNLFHRSAHRMLPVLEDASGHQHRNDDYTLDLIHAAGVRYVWDGTLMGRHWGQDRALTRLQWYTDEQPVARRPRRAVLAGLDAALSPVRGLLNPQVFDYRPDANRQYYESEFPDGRRFYAFPRFGRWRLGDIDGLGALIAPDEIDALVRAGGTAIIYTHLGKRRADRMSDSRHVPAATEAAFRNLAQAYRAGAVLLSPLSELLDYLVLRDSADVDGNVIELRADGIRFTELTVEDVRGKTFGVQSPSANVELVLDGEALPATVVEAGPGAYAVTVEEAR